MKKEHNTRPWPRCPLQGAGILAIDITIDIVKLLVLLNIKYTEKGNYDVE